MKKDDKTYFIATIMGLCIGALFCLSGLVTIILGISGQIEWVVNVAGFESRLGNACPGVVLAIIGMFVLYIYKPRREKRTIEKTETMTDDGKKVTKIETTNESYDKMMIDLSGSNFNKKPPLT